MAVIATVSTLMVLLAETGVDFLDHWGTSGAINDPSGDKHGWAIRDLIVDGNFRSAVVDSWIPSSDPFDEVAVTGRNIWGDALWTTAFNASAVSWDISEWAVGTRMLGSTAEGSYSDDQDVIFSDSHYSFRLVPGLNNALSWFAVTAGALSYPGCPAFFIPKEMSTPFGPPVIRDGYQGCWPGSALNVTLAGSNPSDQSSQTCSGVCGPGPGLAAIESRTNCYCGDFLEPASGDNDAYCYLGCPGNAAETCGGFTADWYSVYFIPGTEPVGSLEASFLYTNVFTGTANVQIDISDMVAATGDPAFVAKVSAVTPAMTPYTLHYSQQPCITGNVAPLGGSPTTFVSDGTKNDVDILLLRCLELKFDAVVMTADISLFGPTDTPISVPVLSVEGTHYSKASTTTSTSTSAAPTTAASTSTTTPAASTTTPAASTTTPTPPASTTTTATTPAASATTPTPPASTTTTATTPAASATTPTPPASTTTTATTPAASATTPTPPASTTTTATTPSASTTTPSASTTTTATTPAASATTPTPPASTTTTATTPAASATTPTPPASTTTTATTPAASATTPTPPASTTTTATTPAASATTTTPAASTTTTTPAASATTTTPAASTTTTTPAASTTTTTSSTSTTTPFSGVSTTTSNTATSSDTSSSTSPSPTVTTIDPAITTTTTTTTDNTPAPSPTPCACGCNVSIGKLNLTSEELQAKIDLIQKALTVNTTGLSSHIRKKTSAEDNRPEAVSIGAVGVALLVSVFVAIFLIDASTLWRDICILVDNIRHGHCCRRHH